MGQYADEIIPSSIKIHLKNGKFVRLAELAKPYGLAVFLEGVGGLPEQYRDLRVTVT